MKDLIKQKRLELKESQAEFGKRFGLSHAAISDIERGITKNVSLDLIDFVLNRRCENCLANLHDQRIIELEDRVQKIEGFLNL